MSDITALVSVSMGASIIEKHFTLDREGGGPDDSFSLVPSEFKQLCDGVRAAWSALGNVNYQRKASEQGNVKFRRSLYFVKDLSRGDLISSDAVRSIRPGFGLAPRHADAIIGRQMLVDVQVGTPVSWEHFV
jgi:N-acetylneuraminate synthase